MNPPSLDEVVALACSLARDYDRQPAKAEFGVEAYQHLRRSVATATRRPGDFGGIPVFVRDDLAAGVWRIIGSSGAVLREGVISE